jgi:hypothetical protein
VNEWLLEMFPPEFAHPSFARRIGRKVETIVFLSKDIVRAVRIGDASEVAKRMRRLVKWMGLRWLTIRYRALRKRMQRLPAGSRPLPADSRD